MKAFSGYPPPIPGYTLRASEAQGQMHCSVDPTGTLCYPKALSALVTLRAAP